LTYLVIFKLVRKTGAGQVDYRPRKFAIRAKNRPGFEEEDRGQTTNSILLFWHWVTNKTLWNTQYIIFTVKVIIFFHLQSNGKMVFEKFWCRVTHWYILLKTLHNTTRCSGIIYRFFPCVAFAFANFFAKSKKKVWDSVMRWVR
jgi:hypothetical protein